MTSWIARCALSAMASAMVCISVAEAYPTYRGKGYYEDNYYSRKPQRGYSGWAGPSIPGRYCDYRRYPVRVCGKSGKCRVKGWRLQQYCY